MRIYEAVFFYELYLPVSITLLEGSRSGDHISRTREMASRSSAHHLSETYQGTRRGRVTIGDMGFEMFPEKYEATDIIEEPGQLEDDQRATLSDFGPEQATLFAYEEPRRVTYGKHRLLLQQTGEFSTTTPWISHGDFDISFTDQDPRGFLTEQPWQEYTRLQRENFKRIDFKDDGDYSTTSGGISPFAMYKNIRSAQNWVKARLKIFDDSYEGRSNGGVGVYAHTSSVFKSSPEDSSVQTDGDSDMATTFEDPENRQRLTMKLSNMVHQGSKALRVNSTTDHKVMVSSYGKLYGQMGLVPHETQMRLVEDDTPLSRLDGMKMSPKNVVKLMSSYVNQTKYDNGNFGDYNSITGARAMQQDAEVEDQKFSGMRGDSEARDNRSIMLTRDCLSLLGITENEVKFVESKVQKNSTQAKQALANMYYMAEMVHKMPAHAKLEMRNELLLRSNGGGLKPGSSSQLRKARDEVIVNPKIVQHMAMSVRTGKAPENIRLTMNHVEGDPVGTRRPVATPVMSYRSFAKSMEQIGDNRGDAEVEDKKFGAAGVASLANKQAVNYSSLGVVFQNDNRNMGLNDQILQDTQQARKGRNARNSEQDFHKNLLSTVLDVNFGEAKGLRRDAKRSGTKSINRHVQSDYHTNDATLEMGAPAQKNTMNRNARTK